MAQMYGLASRPREERASIPLHRQGKDQAARSNGSHPRSLDFFSLWVAAQPPSHLLERGLFVSFPSSNSCGGSPLPGDKVQSRL